MERQDTLSAARLIDNAVKISFAQANLGSQMRRLRARCKRNRPLPRRDGANLLPLGMKADLSTSSDRLPSLLPHPEHPRAHPPFRPFLLLISLSTRIERERWRLELTRDTRVFSLSLPPSLFHSFAAGQAGTRFHYSRQFGLFPPLFRVL